MKRFINYYSAKDFKSFMKSLGFIGQHFNKNIITKEYIEKQQFAIISIGNIEPDEISSDEFLYFNGCNNHWMPSTDNILNINFNDVGENEDGALTNLQVQEILYFIEDNKDKQNWYIHCSAGISRSGALASYLYDWFKGKGYEVIINPKYPETPNFYVKSLLKRENIYF